MRPNTQGSLAGSAGIAAAEQAAGSSLVYPGRELATDFYVRMFGRYRQRQFAAWNGESLTARAGSRGSALPFTLVFADPEAVWSAVLEHDPLVLAESYFRGDLEIEGDFFAALSIKDHLDALRCPRGEQVRVATMACGCGCRMPRPARQGRRRALALMRRA